MSFIGGGREVEFVLWKGFVSEEESWLFVGLKFDMCGKFFIKMF